jgi:hypothetical protein
MLFWPVTSYGSLVISSNMAQAGRLHSKMPLYWYFLDEDLEDHLVKETDSQDFASEQTSLQHCCCSTHKPLFPVFELTENDIR